MSHGLAAAMVPRVEIAPNIFMPLMNFGYQKNHTASIDLGAMGLDTALAYGDEQQREVGAAVRKAMASGTPRSKIFVTSKIPCCPGNEFTNISVVCSRPVAKEPIKAINHDFEVLGLDFIDLMLIHWPCDDIDDSIATYKAMEPFVASGKIKAIGVSVRAAHVPASLHSHLSLPLSTHTTPLHSHLSERPPRSAPLCVHRISMRATWRNCSRVCPSSR